MSRLFTAVVRENTTNRYVTVHFEVGGEYSDVHYRAVLSTLDSLNLDRRYASLFEVAVIFEGHHSPIA